MRPLKTLHHGARLLMRALSLIREGHGQALRDAFHDATPALQFARQRAYIRLSEWLARKRLRPAVAPVASGPPRRLGIVVEDRGPLRTGPAAFPLEELRGLGVEVISIGNSCGPAATNRSHGASLLVRRPLRCLHLLLYLIGQRNGYRKSWAADRSLLADGLRLAADLRRLRVEHFHVQGAGRAASVGLTAAGLTDLPWSVQPTAEDLETTHPPFVLGDKLREAAFVVTQSKHSGAHLARLASDDGIEFRIVRPCVEVETPPPPLEIQPGRPLRLLSICLLPECKGLRTLIEACESLSGAGHRLECRIVMEPNLGLEAGSADLFRRCAALDPAAALSFSGGVSDDELERLYQQADIFVLSAGGSDSDPADPFPGFLTAAMAAQVPVVASRCPGLMEILTDGSDALLFSPGDRQDLARQIERLVADAGLRSALGAQGALAAKRLFGARNWAGRIISALSGTDTHHRPTRGDTITAPSG